MKIGESPRAAARVAGVTSLLGLAAVVFANFAILGRLAVAADPAATVRNILAHEGLFRSAIACFLGYAASLVILLAIYYEATKGVHRGLALFAALCKLVYAFAWFLMGLDLFAVLRLLVRPDYARILGAEHLQGLVKVTMGAGFEQYYGGLLFHALGSAVFGYLLVRSRLVPRALAAGGVIAYAWCAVSTLGFLLLPGFDRVVNPWWFDSPMGIFELALGFWLLLKGWSPEGAPR